MKDVCTVHEMRIREDRIPSSETYVSTECGTSFLFCEAVEMPPIATNCESCLKGREQHDRAVERGDMPSSELQTLYFVEKE